MNAPIQTKQSYRIQELEATIEQQAKRIEEQAAQIALAREAGTQEPKYHDAIECAYAIRKLAEQKEKG